MKILTPIICCLFLGIGSGLVQEFNTELPLPETMVYDCKRADWRHDFITCGCLRLRDIWTCTFPLPPQRFKKGEKK